MSKRKDETRNAARPQKRGKELPDLSPEQAEWLDRMQTIWDNASEEARREFMRLKGLDTLH